MFSFPLNVNSIQLSSVQSLSRPTFCDPINCSTPGLPVNHQLPESTQTHVHRVYDAIQPSHLLSSAGSRHTRPYPWQGYEGENLTGKADQVFRGFEKASSRDPTHDKVTRRKPNRQGRSGVHRFWKAAPCAHLKDDICLSDACFNRWLPNFCDTGRRPSQISFQIRINLEL